MSYQFTINIDVDANNLLDAYKQLDKIMHQEVKACNVSWESSDEAYDHEGEVIDPETLQEARMKAFKEIREKDYYEFPSETTDGGDYCLLCENHIDYGPEGRKDHDIMCKYFRD